MKHSPTPKKSFLVASSFFTVLAVGIFLTASINRWPASVGQPIASPSYTPPAVFCAQLFAKIQTSWQMSCGQTGYDSIADINKDGSVNATDYSSNPSGFNSESWCQKQLNNRADPCAISSSSSSSSSRPPATTYCPQLYSKLQSAWQKSCGQTGYDPVADVDKNQQVGNGDYALYSTNVNNEAWCQQQLGNTTSPCTIQPSVSVTSPNGGETWKIGETHTIEWVSAGIDEIRIDIQNYSATNTFGVTITQRVSASLGSYTFVLPETNGNGAPLVCDHCKVTIFSLTTGSILDESDNYFSIAAANIASSSSSRPPATTYCPQLYSKLQSAWQKSCGQTGYDPVADVDKNQQVGNGDSALYSTNVNNEEWCQQQLGNTTSPCPSVSLTLTSPNGGETLQAGSTFNITWKAVSLDTVSINLINYTNGSTLNITPSVSASAGTFSWSIPSTMAAGSQYKILIGKGNTNDDNDNYFSIAALSACTPVWQCGAWTTCTNSQQARTCVDSNKCGSITGMPAKTQSCSSPKRWFFW